MREQYSPNEIKGKGRSPRKKARILHNPGAGEAETTKGELIQGIESAGFKCSYSSTKGFRWENIGAGDIDFVILAGGDGTVRKVAEELLTRKVIEKKIPIGLLPMGTANNIARTLGISGSHAEIIASWHDASIRKIDVGTISGLDKPAFFLEGFGYGLFPKLMREMKKQGKNDIDDPRDRLKAALQIMRELIASMPAQKCLLEIDGQDYSGEYLLIEVMNIRSIGPNLDLAPDADPGDGVFDVVLIKEDQRPALADYIDGKVEERNALSGFPVVRAKQLSILWDGKHAHVDDEYHKTPSPVKVSVELRDGLLEFLLPDGSGG